MNKTSNALLTALALGIATTAFGQSENLLEDSANSFKELLLTICMWVGIIGTSAGILLVLMLTRFQNFGYWVFLTGLIGFVFMLIFKFL